MMDFDATSFYFSALWNEKFVYPIIEAGFVLKPCMNKTYVDAFIIQWFNQDCNENAFLKLKYYSSPDLIFQHLPVKENV